MAGEIRFVVRETFLSDDPQKRREQLRGQMEEYARLLLQELRYAQEGEGGAEA